jgi:hypothetical protein
LPPLILALLKLKHFENLKTLPENNFQQKSPI